MTRAEIKSAIEALGLINVGVRKLRDGTLTVSWGRGQPRPSVSVSAGADMEAVLQAVRAANG